MQVAMNNEVLNQKEAARLLRISEPTLRQQLRRKDCKIPHKRIGRQYRFAKRKLLEYLER